MHTTKEQEVPKNRLLYDADTLARLHEEYENATEIKRNVKTRAMVYEIRTALRYWFGGQNNHRASDAIWSNCEAIEEGEWVLVNDQIKYADEVSL